MPWHYSCQNTQQCGAWIPCSAEKLISDLLAHEEKMQETEARKREDK
jgi:hypothetical protein